MGSKLLIRTICIVFVLLSVSCRQDVRTNGRDGEGADDPIKIGSILILSGEGASWGMGARNGIQMAVDRINSGGGIDGRRLEVDFQDDQGDPKKAIAAFQHLVNTRDIRIIVGTSWSNTGIPLIEAARQNRVLMISPSLGMAKFNESHELLFNIWPHDYLLSRQLAEYVYKKGHRRIAMVGAEHVWVREQTENFRQRFEELGGSVGFITEPLPGTVDLSGEATRIKDTAGIDAVVSTTDGVLVGSHVAESLKELGVALPIFSVMVDQEAIDAARGGFEGAEFLTFWTPSDSFVSEYETKYGTDIRIGADSAYDAVMMLANGIRETKSTSPEVLARYLSSIKEYEGASGRLISDGRRGFQKSYAVKKVVNGTAVSLLKNGLD